MTEHLEDALNLQDELASESRVSIEKTLYRLAKGHAEKALQAAKEHGRNKSVKEFEHALQAIVLSAILLESFVNYHGQKVFGKEEWQGYDEKAKPCLSQKWQKLMDRASVNDEIFPLEGIGKIVKSRNYIFHHKQFFDVGRRIGRDDVATARTKICANEAKQVLEIVKTIIQKYFAFRGVKIPKWTNQ